MLYGINFVLLMVGLIFWSNHGFMNSMIKLNMGLVAFINGAFFFAWFDKVYPGIRFFMGF